MPELPEGVTSGTLPQVFVHDQPQASLLVQDLMADATQAERAFHPLGSLAQRAWINFGGCRNSSGNVLLKFKDNQSRTYWCQVQLLKHTVSQIYPISHWEQAICRVNSTDRGFKVGIAFKFKHHVLAFETLDLLIQLYWSEEHENLPASQPDVYLEFPRFLEDLVNWMQKRRQVQSNRAGNALALVRDSTEIFPGAGVYVTAEIWHMAGLSPNLTEAEVFDSPSRTARLSAAFFHLAKEAHTTLWPLVRRFLVDYVICVRDEDRLLYSKRLHVYGQDRTYVTERFQGLLAKFNETCNAHHEDEIWVRRCTPSGPFDVFEPDLIRHALENENLNLGSLVFGTELWSQLHVEAHLPEACLSDNNILARYFSNLSIPAEMSPSWLRPDAYAYLFNSSAKTVKQAFHPHTTLYRASKTDIWAVIPAFPDNSAPIPRARPPRLDVYPQKPQDPPSPSPTPMHLCDSGTRQKALLSYIIKHTQDYTVGPLDYCGIARRIKGRGQDMIMYCKGDPRVPEFYHRRRALAEVTAKLKFQGTEKKGLSSRAVAAIDKKLAKVKGLENGEKENCGNDCSAGTGRKRRHSADRDLALTADIILSPRKRRRFLQNYVIPGVPNRFIPNHRPWKTFYGITYVLYARPCAECCRNGLCLIRTIHTAEDREHQIRWQQGAPVQGLPKTKGSRRTQLSSRHTDPPPQSSAMHAAASATDAARTAPAEAALRTSRERERAAQSTYSAVPWRTRVLAVPVESHGRVRARPLPLPKRALRAAGTRARVSEVRVHVRRPMLGLLSALGMPALLLVDTQAKRCARRARSLRAREDLGLGHATGAAQAPLRPTCTPFPYTSLIHRVPRAEDSAHTVKIHIDSNGQQTAHGSEKKRVSRRLDQDSIIDMQVSCSLAPYGTVMKVRWSWLINKGDYNSTHLQRKLIVPKTQEVESAGVECLWRGGLPD
ncbi:hypothetical protein FB451DRAFT_1378109 [Mycena latifolia]|nr:hypothetical protein FB451DRAFT_1378109 [Mycena latifolia]